MLSQPLQFPPPTQFFSKKGWGEYRWCGFGDLVATEGDSVPGPMWLSQDSHWCLHESRLFLGLMRCMPDPTRAAWPQPMPAQSGPLATPPPTSPTHPHPGPTPISPLSVLYPLSISGFPQGSLWAFGGTWIVYMGIRSLRFISRAGEREMFRIYFYPS